LDRRTIVGGGPTFDALRSDRLNLRLIGRPLSSPAKMDLKA
jgi:hypothetical protein